MNAAVAAEPAPPVPPRPADPAQLARVVDVADIDPLLDPPAIPAAAGPPGPVLTAVGYDEPRRPRLAGRRRAAHPAGRGPIEPRAAGGSGPQPRQRERRGRCPTRPQTR